MRNFAKKLRSVAREIAAEKGPFLLFALFLREDATDCWDFVVSAQWLEADKGAALRYLAPKLQAVASLEELGKLSRIVILGRDQPALAAIQSAYDVEHGFAEVDHSNFDGLKIEQAYIITSRRETMAV